jgi:hypothetical protein
MRSSHTEASAFRLATIVIHNNKLYLHRFYLRLLEGARHFGQRSTLESMLANSLNPGTPGA